MPHKPFSIRQRITTAAILVLLLSSLGLFLFLRDYAHRSSDQAFDRVLAASALSIAGAISLEDNRITAELPYAALAMLSSQQRVFYTVRDTQGRLVTGYDDLDAGMPLADAAAPTFVDRPYHGDMLRVATLGRLISFNRQARWVTIRVAETRESRDALAAEILQRGAMPLPIMAAVALILLWFGISRAFSPLRGLEQELRGRQPEDLEPLTSPAPREVTHLVEAVNDFMQRLQAMLDMLHNLVADAAHQVRTPLASLRAQAEVALEETDPRKLNERLRRILRNAGSASLLVNQLLMDATITHRLGARSSASVALSDVIEEVRPRISLGDASRLKISLAPRLRRARVRGDRVALREMLLNLIDNALRHAPDSLVELSIDPAPEQRLILQVADRGPGIPDSEKDAVLKRFVRGAAAQATPGSGLGLAIVESVVRSHDGTLVLRNRPGGGLLVCVSLPLDPSGPAGSGSRPLLGACCAAALMLGLLLGALPAPARAQVQTTRYPAPHTPTVTLTIAGPTDTPVFAVLARAFQRSRPDVAIVYHEVGSLELYEQTVSGALPPSDLLISSAEDLQLRLANDGYARRYDSPDTQRLPAWASWHSEVFGFTFEPIVMVYNTDHYTAETAPRSRTELLRTLERQGPHARIGTYDITRSSVGHLLATQDEMISSNFWGMTNALGRVGVRLSADTRDILDQIEAGQLDLGYNVLGSYVRAYRSRYTRLGVIIPDDYQLMLTRSALILRTAREPRAAEAFIDWLLSPDGQAVIERDAGLGALPELDADAGDAQPDGDAAAHAPSIIQPIALNPALLVGLDQQRHARFLQNWRRLVTDTPNSAAATTGR
ncbi:extracellular solute-binding protein [uncultured Castellaniella sp.]|uniref:sensor histidine kinase n=1 Tax=uncultured Castellaniella sp. TaxID=647907 RepID=UPI0026097204|nr:extracellular solute-binding protein [uncultured Castellaniella sp.]